MHTKSGKWKTFSPTFSTLSALPAFSNHLRLSKTFKNVKNHSKTFNHRCHEVDEMIANDGIESSVRKLGKNPPRDPITQ